MGIPWNRARQTWNVKLNAKLECISWNNETLYHETYYKKNWFKNKGVHQIQSKKIYGDKDQNNLKMKHLHGNDVEHSKITKKNQTKQLKIDSYADETPNTSNYKN